MEDQEEKVFSVPEYDALIEQLEEAKKKVADGAQAAIAALFKAFFAAQPSVTAIQWRQYTPYFNDGEACTFSKHDFEVSVVPLKQTDEDDGEDEDDETFQSAWSLDGALGEAVHSLDRAANADVFEAAFGDHVRVVATREGFHVTEYSHD